MKIQLCPNLRLTTKKILFEGFAASFADRMEPNSIEWAIAEAARIRAKCGPAGLECPLIEN